MPPVRWQSLPGITTTALLLVALFIVNTEAQGKHQESFSMTADGWRPIVGTRKDSSFNDEILHYRNQNGESIKAETPSTSTLTTLSTTSPSIKHTRGTVLKPGNKIPLHSKPQHNHYPLPPHNNNNRVVMNNNHHGHGPHIPLSHIRGKPYLQVNTGGKRHHHHVTPMRVQLSNHGNRDEVFVGAHSSNTYSFYKPTNQQQNNVKTRETIGLGNPYLNQPHHHIDFSNRFALPPSSESVFSQFNSPIQSFIFPKHPQTNDVNYPFQNQNDDYTRNLVPPPLLYKDKQGVVKKIKENGVQTTEKRIPGDNPPFAFAIPQHQKPVNNAEVLVTKEKLNVFHNNIPASYSGDYVDYDFHSLKQPNSNQDNVQIKPQTYEVTEVANPWRDSQKPRKPLVELNVPQFLPTPYRPEGQIVPTLPSQAEVSTIFTKLSQIQRDKFLSTSTPSAVSNDPHFFDVKEVSTHYPILGKPSFIPSPQDYNNENEEITNEITTNKPEAVEEITTKEPAQRQRPYRRRRPTSNGNGRLRVSSTTSTTEEPIMVPITASESYESQKTTKEDEELTERPQIRQRVRPTRYRTTSPSPLEEPERVTRGRNRYRTRLTEENDLSDNQPIRKRVRPIKLEIATEAPEDDKTTTALSEEAEDVPTELPEEPEDFKKTSSLLSADSVESSTTSERTVTTNLHLPENEIEDEITVTVPPTTTTTTLKPNRIRGRPIKYDNSNRPRFSVKDYRQKLNQYATTSSTTESYRTSSENSKFRFPSRGRRPFSTSTPSTVVSSSRNVEEDDEKSRFVPKEPRHGGATTEAIITDKNVKAVNTRLRPFGRYRSTTPPPSSTPKISIKPNLFTRRRPPSVSLKMRIHNRFKKNETELATTTEEGMTTEEIMESEEAESVNNEEMVKLPKTTTEDFEDSGVETTTLGDILKNDQIDYSQRVSDLTSSDKNDYNTFKSVSPTSRRIPNYFTIATDDPILPIEAFFTNFKENNKN